METKEKRLQEYKFEDYKIVTNFETYKDAEIYAKYSISQFYKVYKKNCNAF